MLRLKLGFSYQLAKLVSLRRPDKLHIYFSLILYCLAKDAVVHQFVQFLFEGAPCLFAELGVFADVGLHSWFWLKRSALWIFFRRMPSCKVQRYCLTTQVGEGGAGSQTSKMEVSFANVILLHVFVKNIFSMALQWKEPRFILTWLL